MTAHGVGAMCLLSSTGMKRGSKGKSWVDPPAPRPLRLKWQITVREVSVDKEEGGLREGVEASSRAGRGLDVLVQLRQRRGGERRPRFDSSTLHEGQQLVGDLGQDVLGQPGHAEDLVPGSVDVVSERDELEAGRRRQIAES